MELSHGNGGWVQGWSNMPHGTGAGGAEARPFSGRAPREVRPWRRLATAKMRALHHPVQGPRFGSPPVQAVGHNLVEHLVQGGGGAAGSGAGQAKCNQHLKTQKVRQGKPNEVSMWKRLTNGQHLVQGGRQGGSRQGRGATSYASQPASSIAATTNCNCKLAGKLPPHLHVMSVWPTS